MLKLAAIAAALCLASPAFAHDPVKDGGSLGNSYSSQMARVDDTTMRITIRKKLLGDPADIGKPGTPMFSALNIVTNAASVRAAVEAKKLGYKTLQVLGSRNLTQVQDERAGVGLASAGSGGSGAMGFTEGRRRDQVEVVIELVLKCVQGDVPEPKPSDYIDVEAVLSAYGQQ